MKTLFHIAGASVPGTTHTQPGRPGWKNNQDAHICIQTLDMTIGIVADGCGSGKSSEVGAQIGVKILATCLQKLFERSLETGTGFHPWHRLEQLLLSHLQILAESMGTSLSDTIREYFLFSIVGCVITQETTWIFHCGDGTFALNTKLTQLGPFPGNAPPYLGYRINDPAAVGFSVLTFKTENVQSIMLGTDGVDYITDFSSEMIATWMKRREFFENRDSLRRMLALMNRERIQDGRLTGGPLQDDTTIILIQRKNTEEVP